ncbi:MAG TPA: hypothetical protein DCX14_04445 [Flavobacteriales bacterium]|nr:hypothetical protein [Flavobacteriales bacterium]
MRIAELFLERLSDSKSVVVLSDVDEVVTIMGRPEQFEEDTESDDGHQHQEASGKEYKTKRLYRDADDQVIGGVCSGIGYYFGIDPLWIRLAFVVALTIFGTGVLLYIILMLIVPVAKTASEKLHMKGEPVNIGSIGKTIEDELNAFGERISNDGGAFGRNGGKKLVRGIDRFFYFIAELLRNIFGFIGKFLGIIFVIIGSFCVVALLASVMGIADVVHFSSDNWSASMDLYEWGDIVFDSSEWLFSSVTAFVLLIGIPFLALAYGGFLLLFPTRKVPYLGVSLFGLWFIGLILAIFSGFGILKSFAKSDSVVEEISMQELGIDSDTIIIKLAADPFHISERRSYRASRDFMIKIKDDSAFVGTVDFTVLPNPGDEPIFEITKEANGSSFELAMQKAKAIQYLYSVDSNAIALNAFFSFPTQDMLRNQEVHTKLYLPIGKTIFLHESSKRIIDDIDNVTNTYDPYMVGHHWRMEADGLTCTDCKKVTEEEEDNASETSITISADEIKIETVNQ